MPALALLKIWAWTDRWYTAPGKDASDIWMFLRHYADAGNGDCRHVNSAPMPGRGVKDGLWGLGEMLEVGRYRVNRNALGHAEDEFDDGHEA